jgi:ribosomal protein S18 acetylase RimI-like enzyme
MDAAALPAWIESSAAEYAADLIATGVQPETAHRTALAGMHDSFPNDLPQGGHAVFDVLDDGGQAVGYLWIGPDLTDDPTSWWIWDVLIEPEHRGRGLGRAAMQLGEEYAVGQGATSLGLNVFASNAAARGLYESLGYQAVSSRMRKSVGG